MKNGLCFSFIIMMIISSSAYSAKPVKITPGPKGVAVNGEKFRNYVVQCSNGKKMPLTAWKGGRKWCMGEGSEENCSKKQIKAAKSACKIS